MPPARGVALTLTWADLYGKFDLAGFLALVDESPYDWLVASLSVLGTIVANSGVKGSSQRSLASELLDGELRDRVLAMFDRGERQIIVHPEAVALGMKLAAIRSRSSDALGDPLSLVPILAGLNELTPAELPGPVAALLHIHASQQALWAEDLAREFDLFHRYEAALPTPVRYGFVEKFRVLTGLEALDFSAYALGIYAAFARFRSAHDLEGVDYRALAESIGKRAKRPDEFNRFLSLVSRTRVELVRDLTPKPEEKLSLDDAIAFRTSPIVRLEGGGAAPIWLEWLQDKIGVAPRYILQNAIDDDAEMMRFRGALGEAFEAYFIDLLRRMFPTTAQAVVDVRAGLPGCDGVVLVDDSAIFLELTVSEPSQRLMWSGDERALRDFVTNRLVGKGKLGQLAGTIRDYQSGTLDIANGRPRARRIYPVVVGLTPPPSLYGLDRVIRDTIGKVNPGLAGGSGDVRPVLFTCAKDWEILESLLADGRIDLPATLEGWLATRLRSGLGDHLLQDRGFAGARNRSLAERWASLSAVLTPRAIDLYGLREE